MIKVCSYNQADSVLWNLIVDKSRNGNFLHNRSYMDYHADRFYDASLMVYRREKLVAVFPANAEGNSVFSHSGLTYAGLISTADLGAEETLGVFEAIQQHYLSQGINRLIYKAIPNIFHRYPCQEDLYSLFKLGAKLVRRDLSSAIDLTKDYKFQKGRKWAIARAKKLGLAVSESTDFSAFYEVLLKVLGKINIKPTHSLEELQLLYSKHPESIKLFVSGFTDKVLAGAIVYDFGDSVHTQYLANSEEGRESGALDFLLDYLIRKVYSDRRFFSFGISTEDAGKTLNCGLIAQKEGFGARGVVHDTYEWIL